MFYLHVRALKTPREHPERVGVFTPAVAPGRRRRAPADGGPEGEAAGQCGARYRAFQVPGEVYGGQLKGSESMAPSSFPRVNK